MFIMVHPGGNTGGDPGGKRRQIPSVMDYTIHHRTQGKKRKRVIKNVITYQYQSYTYTYFVQKLHCYVVVIYEHKKK